MWLSAKLRRPTAAYKRQLRPLRLPRLSPLARPRQRDCGAGISEHCLGSTPIGCRGTCASIREPCPGAIGQLQLDSGIPWFDPSVCACCRRFMIDPTRCRTSRERRTYVHATGCYPSSEIPAHCTRTFPCAAFLEGQEDPRTQGYVK